MSQDSLVLCIFSREIKIKIYYFLYSVDKKNLKNDRAKLGPFRYIIKIVKHHISLIEKKASLRLKWVQDFVYNSQSVTMSSLPQTRKQYSI